MPRGKLRGHHVTPPKGRIGGIYSGEKYIGGSQGRTHDLPHTNHVPKHLCYWVVLNLTILCIYLSCNGLEAGG